MSICKYQLVKGAYTIPQGPRTPKTPLNESMDHSKHFPTPKKITPPFWHFCKGGWQAILGFRSFGIVYAPLTNWYLHMDIQWCSDLRSAHWYLHTIRFFVIVYNLLSVIKTNTADIYIYIYIYPNYSNTALANYTFLQP